MDDCSKLWPSATWLNRHFTAKINRFVRKLFNFLFFFLLHFFIFPVAEKHDFKMQRLLEVQNCNRKFFGNVLLRLKHVWSDKWPSCQSNHSLAVPCSNQQLRMSKQLACRPLAINARLHVLPGDLCTPTVWTALFKLGFVRIWCHKTEIFNNTVVSWH